MSAQALQLLKRMGERDDDEAVPQCEASTLKWTRCTKAATHVIGTRYWGDTKKPGDVRFKRRTWVDFHAVCKWHRNNPLLHERSAYEKWEAEIGRLGCANGQYLGFVVLPFMWEDGEWGMGDPRADKLIPQQRFDIEQAGRAEP